VAIRTLILAVALIGAGLYAHDLAASRAFTREVPDLARIPTAFDGWQSEDYPMSESIAEVLAADVTLERRYFNAAGEEVTLFIAYFAEQAVNAQIHSPRHCIPGAGWNITSLTPEAVETPSGAHPAALMTLARQADRRELLYWFRTRGGVVTGEYALKWDLVKNSLARRPTDAAFIRFDARVQDAGAMRAVIARLEPAIQEALGTVGL
jgi:EpsI family protein